MSDTAAETMTMRPRRVARLYRGRWLAGYRAEAWVAAATCGLSLIVAARCIALTRGHVMFSLDDPYIHLALAERIAGGHYGLNPGVPAAPSSSILYPFLLAPLLMLGLGQFAALLVGFASTLATGWLLVAILKTVGVALDRLSHTGLAALSVAVLLGFNLIGLEFTGLEHSLMVAAAMACLLGLVRFLTARAAGHAAAPSWWWLAAALALPLIRYEGATFWIATILVLLLHRCFWQAGLLLALGAAALGGFSWFLHAQGLGWLPSSVLVKSAVAATGTHQGVAGFWRALTTTAAFNSWAYGAILLLAMGVIAGSGLLADRRQKREWQFHIGLFAVVVAGGQLAAGAFGWFMRYEIYALLSVAVLLLVRGAPLLAAAIPHARTRHCVYAAAGLMLTMSNYSKMVFSTPAAARNIYQQQFQMHRLAVDFYRAPVAVNDIGWVSYLNQNYVLDLLGLGSEEVRLGRWRPDQKAWLSFLVQRHRVGMVMIYAKMFPNVPADWVRIGVLTTPDRVTAAFNDVTIYATSPAAVPAVSAALTAFKPTLPKHDRLDIFQQSLAAR